MNASCHMYEWVMSHIWMSHVTHLNESSHTYEWVMSHIWMSHVTHMNKSFTHMNKSWHAHEWVMPHTWMSHATHMNESCHTHEWVMSLTRANDEQALCLQLVHLKNTRNPDVLLPLIAVGTGLLRMHIHLFCRSLLYLHTSLLNVWQFRQAAADHHRWHTSLFHSSMASIHVVGSLKL